MHSLTRSLSRGDRRPGAGGLHPAPRVLPSQRLRARVGCLALAGGLALAPPPMAAADLFVDRAAADGIDFVHFNGMSGSSTSRR